MRATHVVSGLPNVLQWPCHPVRPIQSVPVWLSTRCEMVPGQKVGVCWSYSALGGRPAPGNQGRSWGVGRAYFQGSRIPTNTHILRRNTQNTHGFGNTHGYPVQIPTPAVPPGIIMHDTTISIKIILIYQLFTCVHQLFTCVYRPG